MLTTTRLELPLSGAWGRAAHGGTGATAPVKAVRPFTGTDPHCGRWIARQGRRQIKAGAREWTVYSTEPTSADLARDCPQAICRKHVPCKKMGYLRF